MKLLAIDGNSLAHRAWHAFAPRDGAPALTFQGEPVFAVHGFVSMLATLVKLHRPSHVTIGFDSRNNNRKVLEPAYKAQRKSADPDLHRQMNLTQELMSTVGLMCVTIDGWEADDIVGSASAAAELAGGSCVIATSDRDSFQLVSERTTVWRITSGVKNADEVTPDWMMKKYGVNGEGYLDFAALRGDSSDNLPGVSGVGEKTARVICELGPVETTIKALQDGDAALAASLKSASKKLTADAAAFFHNREIMRIRRDLPIDLDNAAVASIQGAALLRTLTAAGVPSAGSQLVRAVSLAQSQV
jgi:5'-3' exonuclease